MIEVTRHKQHAPQRATLPGRAVRAKARYRALFDGISDAILVCDGYGRFVDANPAAVALLGYSRDELLRLDGSGDCAAAIARALAELVRDGSWNRELELRRPDGSVVLAEVRATTIPSSTGYTHVAVLRDVTEQRRADRERERLREEWTTVVAHDLRQPVTVITGYANLLRQRLGEGEGAEAANRAVEHIGSATRNLKRMIEDLLDLSRIETKRLDLRRQRVDLVALVQAVLERAVHVFEERQLYLNVAGPIEPVEVDPERIEQVLGNLVSNAVKYGEAGSPVHVTLTQRDDAAVVSVGNYGPGISAEAIPTLFSRFNRLSSGPEGNVPGLGLGLYIAKGLVEAHGGQIWVESIPGEVTTFRFSLPLALPDAPSGQR